MTETSKSISNLLFEARILKNLPRSGYDFLGAGKESVAEHIYTTAFIGLVMSKLRPEADGLRLISMCLIHDIPEARTGDLNTVNKRYVSAHENRAAAHAFGGLPFGSEFTELLDEFNKAESLEARLAKDADQLSFILDLKALSDVGYQPPDQWMDPIVARLQTRTGRDLAKQILRTRFDAWWRENPTDAAEKT